MSYKTKESLFVIGAISMVIALLLVMILVVSPAQDRAEARKAATEATQVSKACAADTALVRETSDQHFARYAGGGNDAEHLMVAVCDGTGARFSEFNYTYERATMSDAERASLCPGGKFTILSQDHAHAGDHGTTFLVVRCA